MNVVMKVVTKIIY